MEKLNRNPQTQWSNDQQNSDLTFLARLNVERPSRPPMPLVSEYVANRRVLPPGTPFPGLWDNSITPYNVEIMDCLSPYSPIQHVALMKSAQVGATTIAENAMAYWMDESPTQILYVSATTDLLTRWAEKRLEPLIDSCGFRHKIQGSGANSLSRRTGDKLLSKTLQGGGSLNMSSAQSAPGLRSDSIRLLLLDEVDGVPAELRSGEGGFIPVAEARCTAWGARKKIFIFTTPTTFEGSVIYPIYLAGDQRRFQVPCPYCGHMQILQMGNKQTKYGLKSRLTRKAVQLVYYACANLECGEEIRNHDKLFMLKGGKWLATAEGSSPFQRSYHISSLYSPPGMLDWEEMYEEHLRSENNMALRRSYVNLRLGWPSKETGSRPDVDKVIALRGTYAEGSVPDGVVYLTMGVDVQRGKDNDPRHPARLEMEIMGMGRSYRTWSVKFCVITGEVKDANKGAWEELYKRIEKGEFNFKRRDGKVFTPQITFIDSKDHETTDAVYKFCQRVQKAYPIKGFQFIKPGKRGKGKTKDVIDEIGLKTHKRWRRIYANDIEIYEVGTVFYKNELYNALDIGRIEFDPQQSNFCDFPVDRSPNYFAQLIAEEKMQDGSFYKPHGRANEALDCRVYARCGADVYLHRQMQRMQADARTKRMAESEVDKIGYKFVIDLLAKKVGALY